MRERLTSVGVNPSVGMSVGEGHSWKLSVAFIKGISFGLLRLRRGSIAARAFVILTAYAQVKRLLPGPKKDAEKEEGGQGCAADEPGDLDCGLA